jgi:hypothetical protein
MGFCIKKENILSIEDRHTIHYNETSHMYLFIVIISDTLPYHIQHMDESEHSLISHEKYVSIDNSKKSEKTKRILHLLSNSQQPHLL